MHRLLFLLLLFTISIPAICQTKTLKKPVVKTTPKSTKKPVAKTTAKPSSKLAKTTSPKANTKLAKKDSVQTKTVAQTTAIKEMPKMAMREQQMLDEINYVRTKPNEYKKFILDYISNKNPDVATRKAATEVIKTLEDMQSLPAMQFSNYLYQAAKVHGNWMEQSDAFEHSELPFAENIVGGIGNVREAIISMLIDKDDPQRGHRSNLLNSKYKFIGIYEVKGEVSGMKNGFVQEMYFKAQ